ncbi:MAG: NAD(P)H-dependent oxidoreductase [Bacteroidales bacterium]|nr:NAD(P)H-dependent oxidoreductase [Bacteroidales bacterium]
MKDKVLVLVAHPDMATSVMNKALANVAREVEGVRVMELTPNPMDPELYRQPMADAEVVVFQFPLYWMSAPWILKQWSDTVFMNLCENGYTQGKKLMTVVTTGAEKESFAPGQKNIHTMKEYLTPYEGQANFAQMGWIEPLIVYGNSDADIAARDLAAGLNAYRQILTDLAK